MNPTKWASPLLFALCFTGCSQPEELECQVNRQIGKYTTNTVEFERGYPREFLGEGSYVRMWRGDREFIFKRHQIVMCVSKGE